jgi:hypothetical protein
MTQEIPTLLWETYIHVKTALRILGRGGHNTRTIWKKVCSADVKGKDEKYSKVNDVLKILDAENLIKDDPKPTGFADNSVEHIWTVIDFDAFAEDHKKKMENEYLQERFQHNL